MTSERSKQAIEAAAEFRAACEEDGVDLVPHLLGAPVDEYVSMNSTHDPAYRCRQPGYEEIIVPDGRRGVWVRTTPPLADEARGYERDWESVTQLEICAGREGDDDYVVLRPGMVVTPRMLCALYDVFSTLRFAAPEVEGG